MSSLVDVTPEDINLLSDIKLTKLLLHLLHCESNVHNIPKSCANVSLMIDVPDGGEDGRIKWSGGDDKTDWIPNRYTIYQCKAKEMGPADCGREIKGDNGELKPRIKEVIEANGAYILFYSLRCGNTNVNIRRIKDTLNEIYPHGIGGISVDNINVDVYDCERISQWVNQHFTAIVFIHECNNINLPLSLKTWSLMANYRENGTQYYRNDVLDDYIEEVKAASISPKNVIRIMGLPALGKSRLVFEAFRPSDDYEIPSYSVAFCEAGQNEDRTLGLVQYLVNNKKPGVLVVDDCPFGIHKKIAREVTRQDSMLSAITIDYNEDDVPPPSKSIILRPNMLEPVIQNMIADSFPELSEADINRISVFAAGFPQIAVLLAEQRRQGATNLGQLNDSELLARLLWGRDNPDAVAEKVLEICSLFTHVGYQGRVACQRIAISEWFGIKEFYAKCQHWIAKGLLQEKGDFVLVSPIPLALNLASNWWSKREPENVSQFLNIIARNEMLDSLCNQIKNLHFSPKAQEMTESLCGPNAPFGQAEVMTSREGSRIFRALVQVNPLATADAINRVLVDKTKEELLSITGDERRNLVWSLEDLCWWADTFCIAARLMLAFGVAENEKWANNATNVFMRLFRIWLPGTQASLANRLIFLGNQFERADQDNEFKILMIRALGSALESTGFSRIGSISQQGSRASENDYQPQKGQEIYDYWDKCIQWLVDISCSDSEYAELAKNELGSRLRGLLHYDIISFISTAIEKITEYTHGYWPEALAQLKRTIEYDADKFPAIVAQKLNEWVDMLTPSDIPNKLKLIVSIPEWEHIKDDQGKYIDISADKAISLADALVLTGQEWYQSIDVLLEGDQRQLFVFGRRLGEIVEDKSELVEVILNKMSGMPAGTGNPKLLGYFLSTSNDRGLISNTLNKMCDDVKLVKYVVEVARLARPQQEELDLVIKLVHSKIIQPSELSPFAFNSVLDHLSSETVCDFASQIANLDKKESASIALQIIRLYCLHDDNRFKECIPSIRQIIFFKEPKLVDEHWQEAVIKIVMDDSDCEIAVAAAHTIVELGKDRDSIYYREHYAKEATKVIIEKYTELTWPIYASAILSEDIFHSMAIGRILGYEIDKKNAIICLVPYACLLEWCKAHAPQSSIALAKIIPLYGDSDEVPVWNDLTIMLFDHFGDNEDVLRGISANLVSFTSSGGTEDYWQRAIRLLMGIENHNKRGVREWASKMVAYCNNAVNEAKKRTEEWKAGIF